jgi:hypothetical protein
LSNLQRLAVIRQERQPAMFRQGDRLRFAIIDEL